MKLKEILEARGITEETASRLGWHLSGDELVIPYYRESEVVGNKYRRFGERKSFRQDKGTPQIFYNFDALKASVEEDLLITEGEMDCAIALQCGYLAVSVPNGAPSEPVVSEGNKYKYLQDLPKEAKVILAVDNDESGHNLLNDLALRIGKSRCRWLKYPKGCKDLNDVYLKYGKRGVEETVKRARWFQVDGINLMSELPPPRFQEAIPCPVEGLEDYYKIRLGDFTVVTGIPGMGKTTLVNEITAAMALKYNWNIAIGSFEQNPRADYEPWLQSYYNHKPSYLQTPEQIEAANEWINKRFRLITPTDEDIDLHWLIERIEVAALRHDCKIVVIDPWNELDHIHPREMTQTEYTGFAIKTLKKLAYKLQVHIIVVAHPAKMSRNKDGVYPTPSLYDIADSAHWRNKSDLGIVVHRENDKTSKIIIAKCRYWNKIGKTGEVELRYDDYIHRFVIPG